MPVICTGLASIAQSKWGPLQAPLQWKDHTMRSLHNLDPTLVMPFIDRARFGLPARDWSDIEHELAPKWEARVGPSGPCWADVSELIR